MTDKDKDLIDKLIAQENFVNVKAEQSYPRSSTETLISALRILSKEIQSDDGVANAAIAEAADKLEELDEKVWDLTVTGQNLIDQAKHSNKEIRRLTEKLKEIKEYADQFCGCICGETDCEAEDCWSYHMAEIVFMCIDTLGDDK